MTPQNEPNFPPTFTCGKKTINLSSESAKINNPFLSWAKKDWTPCHVTFLVQIFAVN